MTARLRTRTLLGAALGLLLPTLGTAEPLRFHLPDTGAPPFLYVAPGTREPAGLVAELLARTAKTLGRQVRYEFQPRESAGTSLATGSADGALFFTVTRPAPAGMRTSEPVLRMDLLLVTPRDKPLAYNRPSDLANQRLCTLTDEKYPPLALLGGNNRVFELKGKTEQAALMMLRDDRCAGALINGPMYHWLAARYGWDDLRVEDRPLLNEALVIGFRAPADTFAAAFNEQLRQLKASGELDRLVSRHLHGPALSAAR